MIVAGSVPTTLIDRSVDASSITTNPSANDVIEDTGQVTEGAYWIGVYAWADADNVVTLEHRNAANNANIYAFDIKLTTDQPILIGFPIEVDMATNERIRVIQKTSSWTGDVQVVIWSGKGAG